MLRLKGLPVERLVELKVAAKEQGKELYELIAGDELAAYLINCMEERAARKDILSRYDERLQISRMAKERLEYLEKAINYINEEMIRNGRKIDYKLTCEYGRSYSKFFDDYWISTQDFSEESQGTNIIKLVSPGKGVIIAYVIREGSKEDNNLYELAHSHIKAQGLF